MHKRYNTCMEHLVHLCYSSNCFSSIIYFGQISEGCNSKKKKKNKTFLSICTSKHYVLHYYKVSGNSVERFQRSCADSFSSIFHFGQISKFKKGITQRKKY